MATTTHRAMTISISEETYNKKSKAAFVLKAEGMNFSKKVSEMIEEYAKKFDEQSLEGGN